jgi:beta-glucosidase
MYYNHPNTGRPAGKSKFSSRYLDAPVRPEFCFGYGLSYTTFNYSDLEVEVEKEIIRVSVKVKNTGEREGIETIQIS